MRAHKRYIPLLSRFAEALRMWMKGQLFSWFCWKHSPVQSIAGDAKIAQNKLYYVLHFIEGPIESNKLLSLIPSSQVPFPRFIFRLYFWVVNLCINCTIHQMKWATHTWMIEKRVCRLQPSFNTTVYGKGSLRNTVAPYMVCCCAAVHNMGESFK